MSILEIEVMSYNFARRDIFYLNTENCDSFPKPNKNCMMVYTVPLFHTADDFSPTL